MPNIRGETSDSDPFFRPLLFSESVDREHDFAEGLVRRDEFVGSAGVLDRHHRVDDRHDAAVFEARPDDSFQPVHHRGFSGDRSCAQRRADHAQPLHQQLGGQVEADDVPTFAISTEESERRAMKAVMETESQLGFIPRDISAQNLGYDVESSIPGTGLLRFIEVKGRVRGAKTVTITKNEILTGLNKPEEFILAIVVLDPDGLEVRYVRLPFDKEPDFKATSVNYDLDKLLAQAREPV